MLIVHVSLLLNLRFSFTMSYCPDSLLTIYMFGITINVEKMLET